MEHTKGKLYVSSSTLICDEEARIVANTMQLGTVAGVTVNITEATAYAAELVRRWNAFEDGGLVDELRKACEEAQKVFGFIAENYKSAPHFPNAERLVEAALAKC